MTGHSTVDRARHAVYGAFVASGAMYAAFLSRVPDIKHQLDLSTARLGVALLALSIGAVLALPLSGRLVSRFGSARTLVAAGFGLAGGLVTAGVAVTAGAGASEATGDVTGMPLLMAGLAVMGVSTGVYNVAMNLQGTQVERRMGRAIMPRFHAAFSAGTVASALGGALAAYAEVPVFPHLTVVALGYVGAHRWFRTAFLPDAAARTEIRERRASGSAWLQPRTLAIGLVALAAAFTEGTANDWLAVALSEGYSLPHWLGVLGFAVFVAAMTAGRLAGTGVLDRIGRVPALYAGFGAAVVGTALVVFGGLHLALIGAAIWGIGASLGFPVAMSAAADDPEQAAARVSVVTTIGYGAFVAGPPLLGFVGEHVGSLHALLAVGGLAVVALAAVPSVREPRKVRERDEVPAR